MKEIENINNNRFTLKEETDTRYPAPDNQLQYISQGKTIQEHLENIEKVCKAGGNWIQLRLKEVSLINYLNAAKKCREICDNYGATFIVNDNVGIAAESQADGVHVGLTDTNPKEAQKQLGENAIIGGTANTLKDCIQHIKDGVDYIGLGPFRFTTTKDKLSPVLGFEGYSEIIHQLNKEGYEIPLIAIGGITIDDLPELIKTGVSGIAVSGLLSNGSEIEIKQKINDIKSTISF